MFQFFYYLYCFHIKIDRYIHKKIYYYYYKTIIFIQKNNILYETINGGHFFLCEIQKHIKTNNHTSKSSQVSTS
jgi:hypothetical protein